MRPRPNRLCARHRAPGLAAIVLVVVGCTSSAPPKAELPPPVVSVDRPQTRTVQPYEVFVGRAEGFDKVEVRALVGGYLTKIHFTPGTEVAAGQELFEIDPEPYQVDLVKAKADLAQADLEVTRTQAIVVKAVEDFRREDDLFAKGAGAKQTRDAALAQKDASEAEFRAKKAAVDARAAQVKTAELNLRYCTVKAPIGGVIGDRLVSRGNLVIGGVGNPTLLTTIITGDPIYIAFDIDENTLQRFQQAVRTGALEVAAPGQAVVEAGMAVHGTDYPLRGRLDFVNNTVDAKTGTIRVKAKFDNPKPKTGSRLLAPEMFARVRVPLGKARAGVLVPEEAVLSDQGVRYLYAVGADNKAVRLDVTLGVLDGGLRVIEAVRGPTDAAPRPLAADERVIVSGVQRVRPGMTVEPKPAR